MLTATHLLPGVWRQIDWRSLRWVIAGCALTTPLGVAFLGGTDANSLRLAVSACLLVVAAFMLTGAAQRLAPRKPPGAAGAFVVGCGSGLLNGAAGIGGPPAVVFYFSAHSTAVGRATLIGFFVFTDVYPLALAGASGLLEGAAWKLVVVSMPFALAGIAIGSRIYLQLDEATLRRWIWRLLFLLGSIGVVSAAWRLAVG